MKKSPEQIIETELGKLDIFPDLFKYTKFHQDIGKIYKKCNKYLLLDNLVLGIKIAQQLEKSGYIRLYDDRNYIEMEKFLIKLAKAFHKGFDNR